MQNYEFIDDYSERTHPIPDGDSRFYRLFKPELSLSNPTVTYCKYRKRLFANTEENSNEQLRGIVTTGQDESDCPC